MQLKKYLHLITLGNMKELKENITPASIGGMGEVSLPNGSNLGSGDIPAGQKKKKKKKMKHLETFESFSGNMSDFKYEFPIKFEEATGNSIKAIKKISKKGKSGYEVRTSTYMSEPEMKLVADAMGMELKSYLKSTNVAITVFESNQNVKLSESVMSELDIIRQESSNLSNFIKRVFNDPGFKQFKGDKSFKEFLELTYNYADQEAVAEAASKSPGLVQFVEDEKSEGKSAEIHLAKFSGRGIEAQSTTKTWDDGVPVTKYFTRGGYKKISPKGEYYIIESDDWWYFCIKSVWYAVKRKDYGTPPFEY